MRSSGDETEEVFGDGDGEEVGEGGAGDGGEEEVTSGLMVWENEEGKRTGRGRVSEVRRERHQDAVEQESSIRREEKTRILLD